MILSQFEEAIWHRRGSDCDIAEAWHHGGEIVSAVEAVLEFGKILRLRVAARSQQDSTWNLNCPGD
jgi:hypothetical protein